MFHEQRINRFTQLPLRRSGCAVKMPRQPVERATGGRVVVVAGHADVVADGFLAMKYFLNVNAETGLQGLAGDGDDGGGHGFSCVDRVRK